MFIIYVSYKNGNSNNANNMFPNAEDFLQNITKRHGETSIHSL